MIGDMSYDNYYQDVQCPVFPYCKRRKARRGLGTRLGTTCVPYSLVVLIERLLRCGYLDTLAPPTDTYPGIHADSEHMRLT